MTELRGPIDGHKEVKLAFPQRHEVVTIDSVQSYTGAAVMNSWTPGPAVTQIASVVLSEAQAFLQLLHKSFRNEAGVMLQEQPSTAPN